MSPATPHTAPTWTASSPASIDEDLRGLWEAAARHSPVSRALMSNLVIVANGEGPAEDAEREAGELLPSVARRHPARVVLLNHRCSSDAQEPHDVRVGLLTIGSSEHRYGIELISFAVACLDESLPSILRAVTRGDVPTTLWLTGDLSAATPAMPLVETSRQMVYDSARWKNLRRGFQGVADLLAAPHAPDLVDLAWRRLAPMRRAVATALEPLRFDQRPRPEQTTIKTAAGRTAEAWLLWGWLQTRLGWTPTTAESIAPQGDGLEVHFQGEGWQAAVVQPAISGTGKTPPAIEVRDTAGRTVTVSSSHESVADALSDELTSLSHDLTLERIVRSLAT